MPMSKTTILKPLELKEDLYFSKKHLQQQATIFFECNVFINFKVFYKFRIFCCLLLQMFFARVTSKLMIMLHSLNFKNLLHLDEETYILSFKSKLMKPKKILK
jgi:hypothetical protein